MFRYWSAPLHSHFFYIQYAIAYILARYEDHQTTKIQIMYGIHCMRVFGAKKGN